MLSLHLRIVCKAMSFIETTFKLSNTARRLVQPIPLEDEGHNLVRNKEPFVSE